MMRARVLKEQLEGQRLRFTDEQRIRLAVKAKVLGRRLLDELDTLVTPVGGELLIMRQWASEKARYNVISMSSY